MARWRWFMRSNEPVGVVAQPRAPQHGARIHDRDPDGLPVWNGPTIAIDRPVMTRAGNWRSQEWNAPRDRGPRA